MAFVHSPELRIGPAGGTVIDTFDAYDVSLDCFQPGSPFTFSLWRSESRRSTWARVRSIKVGDEMTFRMDGALLMNGFINKIDEQVDRQGGARVIVSGTDLGARAMAADANPAVCFTGLNIEDGLRRLYLDIGIGVVVGVRAEDARALQVGNLRGSGAMTARRRRHTHAIDRSHPRAGEKVWQLAETIVRRVGLFQWVAPIEESGKMALVIDRYDYHSDPLYEFSRRLEPFTGTLSGNIRESSHSIQTADIPTYVRVFGHGSRGNVQTARYAPGRTNGYIATPSVTHGRVIVPHPKQPRYLKSQRSRTLEAANQEADRIIAKAMMGFRKLTVTVQGHAQGEGNAGTNLYAINTTASVVDEVLGINERMFIHRVAFKGRRQSGTETTVSMVPLDAVQLTVGVVEPT